MLFFFVLVPRFLFAVVVAVVVVAGRASRSPYSLLALFWPLDAALAAKCGERETERLEDSMATGCL